MKANSPLTQGYKYVVVSQEETQTDEKQDILGNPKDDEHFIT